MKSLTRADVERLAIKGTHKDFRNEDGSRMLHLNAKTGGTESWATSQIPTEDFSKIRIFVRYVGSVARLNGMEGKTAEWKVRGAGRVLADGHQTMSGAIAAARTTLAS